MNKRISAEIDTIEAMITLYCTGNHSENSRPCKKCNDLLQYAEKRLCRCPFAENKPTCAKCTVHCYNRTMREQVKKVMKYSGPRMLFRHPVMAIKHIFQGLGKAPVLKDHK